MAAPIARAQTAQIDHAQLARAALEKHIRPAYHRLAGAFAGLEQAASADCAAPSAKNLEVLRGRFADAVRAWGGIAHIGFGPVRDENRYERIWFWPDRKGIGRRQVANALRERPADYTKAETLSAKSVGVQGLGALEDVLYGDQAASLSVGTDETPFTCGYATAIGANLKAMADKVDAAWGADGAFARLWLNPGADNPVYLKDQETTFALLKAYSEGLEHVRDVELARPLGVSESRRVLPGPFADSKLTMVYIAARVAGLRSLYLQSGMADEFARLAKAKPDQDAENALKQVLFELDLAEKRSGELAQIPDLLGASPKRQDAVALGYPLKNARALVEQTAGLLTNLPVGFNASDGD
jgi:predicted lipoprotein